MFLHVLNKNSQLQDILIEHYYCKLIMVNIKAAWSYVIEQLICIINVI